MKRHFLLPILIVLCSLSACRVDFTPNAEWKDVPTVYCVLDPEEDTIWARVQRCYLGQENLYNYAHIFDSNNYATGTISVHISAWRGPNTPLSGINATCRMVDSWVLRDTLRYGKPEGNFSSDPQPVFYCVPSHKLSDYTDCVFQLLIINNYSGDTIARATTDMVGFLDHDPSGIEDVVLSHNSIPGYHFGFIPVKRNEIKWRMLPRGRYYQPGITFYYQKGDDTLSIDVIGTGIKAERFGYALNSKAITEYKFLQTIKAALQDNTDTLFNVNHVDILIYACNEDLNAYITSQNIHVSGGQGFSPYTNIEGGLGIFGSRRTHIRERVPCDSTGKPGYLPDQLHRLGVGFYGNFTPAE